jgi:hypothetical protein
VVAAVQPQAAGTSRHHQRHAVAQNSLAHFQRAYSISLRLFVLCEKSTNYRVNARSAARARATGKNPDSLRSCSIQVQKWATRITAACRGTVPKINEGSREVDPMLWIALRFVCQISLYTAST